VVPSRRDGFIGLRGYALLSDMRAAALVAADGAVDWLALPTLDTAPACSALLDPARGGSITLSPTIPYQVKRRYLPGTMVLETTFTTESGTVRVTDALTMGALGALPWTELARLVEVDAGEVPLAWMVAPGHGLTPAVSPWVHAPHGSPMLMVGDCQLAVVGEGLGEGSAHHDRIGGRTQLSAGQSGVLAVIGTRTRSIQVPTTTEIRERVERTIDTWRHWSELVAYDGRWRAPVTRSALMLKALTLKTSGAIAAAATTSLPEQVGGQRNYDYRFAWIRDSAFALDAMSRLGLSEELHAGVCWMLDAIAPEAPTVRVFYSLDGQPVSAEMTEVDTVPGYRNSRPVNLGNSAASQLQLGAYGHLFDAVWHYSAHGGNLTAQTAAMLGRIADHVCDIWASPDAGLWELGDARQYTSSKLGCWTALDRAVRLADAGHIHSPHSPRWRWEQTRIRAFVDERCWSEVKHAYSFYAGSDDLDAAVLLMARFGYCEARDPRLASTIDAIMAELDAGDALLYRYSGQRDKEGAFLACSCWLIEALVHAGRLDDANQRFATFLTHANDVGLLSEEIDPQTRDLLGNLPQALSHLALINAATALDTASSDGVTFPP
jgi:GH15 family glucan-1,4-alpha-glucosidase